MVTGLSTTWVMWLIITTVIFNNANYFKGLFSFLCFKCKVLILSCIFHLFNCWTQLRMSASVMGLLAMVNFILDNDFENMRFVPVMLYKSLGTPTDVSYEMFEFAKKFPVMHCSMFVCLCVRNWSAYRII